MRNTSANYFFESNDSDSLVISDDKHPNWPVTLRIGQVNIFMTHLQLVELVTAVNSEFDSYMRGPNYGK